MLKSIRWYHLLFQQHRYHPVINYTNIRKIYVRIIGKIRVFTSNVIFYTRYTRRITTLFTYSISKVNVFQKKIKKHTNYSSLSTSFYQTRHTQEIEPVPDIHVDHVPIHISAGTTAFRVPLITPIEASHLQHVPFSRISRTVSRSRPWLFAGLSRYY